MIALLWALLVVLGYVALAAFFYVYREHTWMRLLPRRRRPRSGSAGEQS
jgi:hypothetical protein